MSQLEQIPKWIWMTPTQKDMKTTHILHILTLLKIK